jgi:hypothetical protein
MKYFYFYILILLFFIILISYWNTYLNSYYQEPFNSEKQTFILLGDSILNNESYVSKGKSICNLLIERTYGKTICLAVDDSKIVNVYNQINKISDDLNYNLTTIFLSIGGNDILSQIENNQTIDQKTLDIIFSTYKKIIKNIQVKLPEAKLVVCDIYYPNNLKYKQFHQYIEKWNELLYNYAREENSGIYSVFKISKILTKSEDFTVDIEPSSIGSQKMVDAILSVY